MKFIFQDISWVIKDFNDFYTILFFNAINLNKTLLATRYYLSKDFHQPILVAISNL